MRGYEITERGKIFLAVLLVLILLVVPAAVIAISSAAGQTPEPEEPNTSAPVAEEPPGQTQSPDNTTEPPGQTQPPDDTTEPLETETPDVTEEPSETESPDKTPEPPVQTQPPDDTTEPPETESPEVTEEPLQTESPDNTQQPVQTETPDKTPEPPKQSEPPTTQKPAAKPTGNDSNSSTLAGGKLSFVFNPYSKQKLDEQLNEHVDAFLEIPDYMPNYRIIVETPNISGYGAQTLMRTLTLALAKRGVKPSMLEFESTKASASPESFGVKLYFVSIKVK